MRPSAFCLLFGAIVGSSLLGGEVQTWSQQSKADFEEGTREGVVVTSDGQVELARQVDAVADIEAIHVWGTARTPDGSILVATGGPGMIVRVPPEGEQTKLYESKDQQVFGLTVSDDGTIYYATSPGGQVFQQKPDGDAEVFFETKETYVWGLALDGEGSLLVATGPTGRLYRVNADGEGELFYQARQKHLLSLAVGDADSIFVGTSDDGLVLKIDSEGVGFVLYDAPQADVQALVIDEAGNLFAGTGTPERPFFPGTTDRDRGRPDGRIVFDPWRRRAVGVPLAWGLVGWLQPALAPVAEAPVAPAPSAPRPSAKPDLAPAGENSVYRIARDGQVDEIFREKCLVLSLALQNGQLLVGTGQDGRLYLVDPTTHTRQTLAQLASGQIQSMMVQPDGRVVLGTGTPGDLWQVQPKFREEGVIESRVFDAKLQSRWGRAVWQGDVPTTAGLQVSYRAGNIEEPDDTWADWSDDPSTLPLARFLQFRALLESTDGQASPSLSGVTVYYATINRAPTVDSIDVPNLIDRPITGTDRALKIEWTASDPNGDTLWYDLDVKRDDWPEWVAVTRELTATEYSWQPDSMPSGRYRIRVSASDAPSNRQADLRRGERISEPFQLDRDAPRVTIQSAKVVDGRFEVTVSAKDEHTRLTQSAYSLNGSDWWPLFPDDGLFDSSEESITFRTGELSANVYLLLVRFQDSAGHQGIADQVIRMPTADSK